VERGRSPLTDRLVDLDASRDPIRSTSHESVAREFPAGAPP
jgi:hypothetical protein